MRSKTLGLAATAAALALVVSACGGSSSSSSSSSSAPAPAESAAPSETAAVAESASPAAQCSAPADRKSVTFIAVGFANTYAAAAIEAAEKRAPELNIDLTVLDSQFNAELQAQQLAAAAASTPDGIIVWSADPKGIIPASAAVSEAGIPLTFMNQDIDPSGKQYRIAFTGPDNYTQGKLQFDLMLKGLAERGITDDIQYAAIRSFAGSGAQVERQKGFEDQMAAAGPELELLTEAYGESDVTKSRAAAAQILTKFGDQLDAIYAQDDNVAVGVAQAVKEAGLTDKIIIIGNGFSKQAEEAIKAGEMYGTLVQSPSLDGGYAVETMAAILCGADVEEIRILPAPEVRADNYTEFVAEW